MPPILPGPIAELHRASHVLLEPNKVVHRDLILSAARAGGVVHLILKDIATDKPVEKFVSDPAGELWRSLEMLGTNVIHYKRRESVSDGESFQG